MAVQLITADKFTPGPWQAGGSLVSAAKHQRVALALLRWAEGSSPDSDDLATADTDEHAANAALIAAAPELLLQLRRVLDQWQSCALVGPTVFADAQAAIERATTFYARSA